jgi:dihydrodipicolinate reductase
MTLNRDEMIKHLTQGEVTIEFTKIDGSNRVMKATLQENVVPVTTGASRAKDTNLVVFDTEKNAWRTVVIDRIVKFSA